MKFECDSCHAQYMIADEKVTKKGVKVKCKRCSHTIIVRPAKVEAAAAVAPKVEVRVEQAERSKVAATDAPPNLDATSPGEPAHIQKSAPEVTGPSRPAPVSMMATELQLGAAAGVGPASSNADLTLAGAVVPPTEHAPPAVPSSESGSQEEKTVVQAAPPPPPPEPAVAVAPPAPPPAAKGESSIGDALDDQLAGAFNQMFDGSARPGLDALSGLAGLNDSSSEGEEQRGPTRVLDLDAMNALRQATAAPTSVVDRDALDSLRKDLSPQRDESSGLWDDKKALKAKAEAEGDDGRAEAVWHAAIDDEDVGPLTLAELGRQIEAGRVDRDALVWKSGMENWLPAGEIHDVKALFDRVPMPKIAGDDPKKTKNGKANFDVGAPIDDLKGGSPFDAAPPMDEGSDPSWRPHGLTDVYQAANLAEAAGGGMGLIGGNAGMSARGGGPSAPPVPSEPEWRPSASSALASLVNDEIDRISKGPLPADDDDLNSPRPADDASISGGAPFSNLAGADLDAGPEVSDSTRGRSHQHQNGFDNQFGQQPSFAPQAVQPARPVWLNIGVAAIAVVLLGMGSLVTYKVVFATPQPQQVLMIGPDGRPIQPGAQLPPVAVPVPVAVPPPASPAVVAIAPAAIPALVPVVDPAVAPVAVAVLAPGEETAAKEPPKGPKIAAVKTPPRPPKEPPKEPDPPVVVREPPKVTPKGCDPVLDFDCKPGGKVVEPPKASKETLEKSDILPIVRDALPKVKACGAKFKATGSVKMSWKIDKGGKPQDVAVADPKFGGTPVGACVTAVVKGMKFPAYSGKSPPPVSIPLPLQ